MPYPAEDEASTRVIHFTGSDDEDTLLNGCCIPENFIQCFIDYPLQLKVYLRAMLEYRSSNDAIVWNTLLELYLRKDLLVEEVRGVCEESGVREEGGVQMEKGGVQMEKGGVQMEKEGVQMEKEGVQMEKEDTNNSIDALYEKQVMSLLTDPRACYDCDQALVLIQMHDFKKGQVYLYEKYHMYNMLLKHYLSMGETEMVIATCKRVGKEDPSLWIQLLSNYAEMKVVDTTQLNEVLTYLYDNEIVTPLMAFQILAKNPAISLGVVKKQVVRCIQEKKQLIEEDRNKVSQLQTSVKEMEEEIFDVKTYPCTGL